MPPSTQLLSTFQALVADFNGAYTATNYNNFQQYLHNSVLIERVDDASFIAGSASDIVNLYLNPYEAETGYFPQFDYGSHPHPKEHPNKKDELVGEVTGKGYYWDKYADLGSSGMHVQYCLRFKPNSHGTWLLATALVVPI